MPPTLVLQPKLPMACRTSAVVALIQEEAGEADNHLLFCSHMNNLTDSKNLESLADLVIIIALAQRDHFHS